MVLNTLIKLFGRPKNNYFSGIQFAFNCPKCRISNGGVWDNKHNLEVKLAKRNVFHCWKCDESGDLLWLLKRWGPQYVDEYRQYQLDFGYYIPEEKEKIKVSLPEDFIPFSKMDRNHPMHIQAFNYMTNERKVDHATLLHYRIGFCVAGRYRGRIIIPSYDRDNELNYFSARTFIDDPVKYDNAKVDRSNIIFNEYYINWNLPVIITEGPFEFLAYPHNNLVLLSKVLNDKVHNLLIEHKPNVLVCLNGDAMYGKKDNKESKLNRRVKAASTVAICRQLAEAGVENIGFVKLPENDLGEISELSGKKHIFKMLKECTEIYASSNNLMVI